MTFTKFKKKYGPGKTIKKLPVAALDQVEQQVAPDLRNFLAEEGIATYDKGFLFTVDTREFEKVLGLILPQSKNAAVVVRTAFGDLYLEADKTIYLYQPSYHKFTQITESISYFFDVFLLDVKFPNSFFVPKNVAKSARALRPVEE